MAESVQITGIQMSSGSVITLQTMTEVYQSVYY